MLHLTLCFRIHLVPIEAIHLHIGTDCLKHLIQNLYKEKHEHITKDDSAIPHSLFEDTVW
jgi:hypothetical protein